jgi:hypothetical protein
MGGTSDSVLAHFSSIDHIDRCKIVHTPMGVEALVPESIVRERYSKVYRTYNRIRGTLASDSNEYLPFYRLPDDLMIEIWDYLNVCDRHSVASVSRRFRSVAVNTARLWRFVNFSGSSCVPRIDTLLKRAGVAPLHIRVTDHQLSAIRPPLPPPSPRAYHLLPPPPPPPPLPPPPSLLPPGFYLPPAPSFFHHITPTPSFYTYVPPVPSFYPQLPRPQPILPNPSVETIFQAAVLDVVVAQKHQSAPNLEIPAVTLPMRKLRSLRLSLTTHYAHYPQSASIPVTKPFFGGHTPLLRHLAVIQFSLNWSDPIFRNLTYLLVRRPDAPVSGSLLVHILRSCPSLIYLGLEVAISPTGPDEVSSSVELPALQRLYITDKDTWRINAILNHINAPNVLECDFTSADWGWFDNHPTLNSSPLNRIQATQDVILRATERFMYRWTIECRWGAKHAVRLHFDPAAANYYTPGVRNEQLETTRFINTLQTSPIPFGQVRSLTLRGAFRVETLMLIFGLFPAIESLSSRGIYPPRIAGAEYSGTILDILSVQYSPQLRAIDVGAWPVLAPLSLLMWLSARSAPGGGCSRLNKVVVMSEQPLPSKMRSTIAAKLDRFLWRKPTTPGMWHYCPPLPDYPTDLPSPITNVTTPQQNEDASWDEEDEEEWARVPSPPDLYPPNVNSDVQDDPTLVYCDRALQGRWDYFAMPGS